MATPVSSTVIELHRNGVWHAAATLTALGSDRCRFDYLPGYIFGTDPWPIDRQAKQLQALARWVPSPSAGVC